MAGVLTPGSGNDFRYKGTTDGGPPATGSFTAGDWVEDASTIWICVAAGTPGSWASAAAETALVPQSKSANYTAAANEYILADTSTAGFTVTLPVTPATGTIVQVKNTGNKTLTVAPGAGATIDGYTTRTYPTQNLTVTFRYDGTNWQIDPFFLPAVYLKPQISTAVNPAGANTNFCLVIPNQITTGSANDGVHDLVIVLGNNPSIGDADMHIARGTDNTTGVLFMEVPLKLSTGLDFTVQDHSNNIKFRLAEATGDVTLAGGNLNFSNNKSIAMAMVAGSAATVGSDTSNRLNIQPGSGGLRILNNAFSVVNVLVTDAGVVTLANDLTMTSGKFINIGGTATLSHDGSNRLNVEGGAGGIRVMNSAFNAVNLNIADGGDLTPRDGANLILATGTGMKIGTGTTQKLGFWNATPITQPTRAGALTDNSGGTSGGTTIAAIGGAVDPTAALKVDTANAVATLAAKVNAIEAKMSAAAGGSGITA